MTGRRVSESLDKQGHADVLAAYLPNDELFAAKWRNGSTLRALMLGLAQEVLRADGFINEFTQEYDPRTTTKLITEWETAVGVPTDCFDPATLTLAQRRGVVVSMLSALFRSESNFNAIPTLLGVPAVFRPATEVFAFPFTFPFVFMSGQDARFTLVLRINRTPPTSGTFPFTFPLVLSSPNIPADERALICLAGLLKPAMVKLLVSYGPLS